MDTVLLVSTLDMSVWVFACVDIQPSRSWIYARYQCLFDLCIIHLCFSLSSTLCQLEMYNNGDILRSVDLMNSSGGRLYQMFKRVGHLIGISRSSTPQEIFEDRLILRTLLQACILIPIF